VYEDAEIFARALWEQQHIGPRDYQTYRELYEVLVSFLPPPDLVVYLRASVPTLQRRIAQRGREYERSIATEYLEQLNELYEDWMRKFQLCPVLTVPADALDFVHEPAHLELIVGKIREKLSGKEEVVFV
jgi:deoxyadenosine/deoxycytidine kinase